MIPFRFTEEEWDAIGALIETHTDRLRYGGDRHSLELTCALYLASGSQKRRLKTPARARDAWINVAAAAERLARAIDELDGAGAASFSILDNHRGEADGWRRTLGTLPDAARYWAECEMYVERDANNADPARDALVLRLVCMWAGFGGAVRTSYGKDAGGPLVRFLAATTAPVMAAAGKNPMTADTIRALVRKAQAEAA